MAMENGPVEDVFPIENGDFLLMKENLGRKSFSIYLKKMFPKLFR